MTRGKLAFMLAVTGFALLFVAAFVFRWTLLRGRFRRYPYEQFVIVGASVFLGMLAVSRRATALSFLALGAEVVALGLLVWYMSVGARFRRGNVAVSVGDRFPRFTLPDSSGQPFDSTTLDGQTALYLFYRGHW